MMCEHAPRRIAGPWGEAFLTQRGAWWMARRTAAGLEAVAVDQCPGCGVKLWGMPTA